MDLIRIKSQNETDLGEYFREVLMLIDSFLDLLTILIGCVRCVISEKLNQLGVLLVHN